MKQRKLKVRKGRRYYTPQSQRGKGYPKVPFLLLQGNWLEKAGFGIDTPVSVTVEEGRLSIVRDSSR
ncbi:SymE family type I addiction module toxin [Alcanivoracaceae bacterium MT1]